MKLIYTIAGLTFFAVSCSPKDKENTARQSSIIEKVSATEVVSIDEKMSVKPEATTQIHRNLTTSLKYVDTDGVYLSLNDTSLETGAVMYVIEAIENELKREASSLPSGLSLTGMIEKTQLNQIRTSATSVKKVEGGWKNKTFYDLGGSQSGVFSVFKGMGNEWGAYSFAPSGSDIVQEFDLNLENLSESFEYLIHGVDTDTKAHLMKIFQQVISKEKEMAMLVNGLHARMSIVVKFDESKKIQANDKVEFPNVDVVLKLDGVYELFQQVEASLEGALEKEVKNGLVYYSPVEEVEQQPGIPKVSPVIVVDELRGSLWASLRTEFLEVCLGDGPKLKDDAEFKGLMRDLSESGNLFTYVSHDVINSLSEMYHSEIGKQGQSALIKTAGRGGPERSLAKLGLQLVEKEVFPMLLESKGGYAYTLDLNKDGLLMSSRTPIPMKGQFGNSGLMAVPALAAISSPIIIRQIARARATQALNNGKDIYLGLRDYAMRNSGVTPGLASSDKSSNAHLRELFMSGVWQDEKPFFVKGIDGFSEGDSNISGNNALSIRENIWAYVPGSNLMRGYADTPILMAPFKQNGGGKWTIDEVSFGGQFVVVRCDGSANIYSISADKRAVYDDRNQLIYKDGEAYIHSREGMKKFKVAMPEL